MPTPQSLSRIAAIFNVQVGIFDRLAPRCRASRLDVEEALRQGAGEPPGLGEELLPQVEARTDPANELDGIRGAGEHSS